MDNLETFNWGKINLSENLKIELKSDQILEVLKEGNNLYINLHKNGSIIKNRFIVPEDVDIELSPSFPELPIVIRSASKLAIFPGERLNAFVEVPMLLSVNTIIDGKSESLFEEPLGTLSKSFFGNTENGELAYSLETPLYSNIEDYKVNKLMGYCPISIINKSNSIMNFDRMILRVPNLTIYRYPDYLAGSPVHVTFTSFEQNNQSTIKKRNPIQNLKPVMIYQPRQVADNNLLRKSFYFIKTIYNG